MQTTAKIYLNDKTWARWTALILVASMMFFAYMFVDVISPIQTLIQNQLGWSSEAVSYTHLTLPTTSRV